MWVGGVDGCRSGWIAVGFQADAHAKELEVWLCTTFRDVLTLNRALDVVAVDMPIGLLDRPEPGGRLCDREARRMLRGRCASIFSPVTRPGLDATSYEEVKGMGLSLSRQSFGIIRKIREVDRLMSPTLQRRIFEAHPELAFQALAGGRPARFGKRTKRGRQERLSALARVPDPGFREGVRALTACRLFPRMSVGFDDMIDACALAWTAMRIAQGRASCLPSDPPRDARALRMEIWY